MIKYILAIAIFLFIMLPTHASTTPDSDHDGLSDWDEIHIYHTDPHNPDTDGDSFKDGIEAQHGFSPLNPKRVKICTNDFDHDGLSDCMEIKYGTDLTNPNSDHDGYKDGYEVAHGFDPTKGGGSQLTKHIEVDLKHQKLSYYQGKVPLGQFKISSGKWKMPTPKGSFKILNKVPKAWSRDYGLWMPYWMGLGSGKFGIHELPVWPNGYREGVNHLGHPVSHGCIRLGIGPAQKIYNWAEVGTGVKIY